MAWAPRYGLKGIIDASVISRINSCNGGSYNRILPLEFKTGKGTSGQVSIHSLMVDALHESFIYLQTATAYGTLCPGDIVHAIVDRGV